MSARSEPLVETPGRGRSGVPWLAADAVPVPVVVGGVVAAIFVNPWLAAVAVLAARVLISVSFSMLTPNQAGVLTLFGAYRGTDLGSGLRIAKPLYSSRKVSLRIRNFTTSSSKVNDANGNPIHIAAVVVWQVVDTARATFGVDDFIDYVHIQSESAVRQMARAYPYDVAPVSLDADRRAQFAANLMTVIASDSPTTPVVNVGADAGR